ncbi:nuclear transport factor 2-like isoform X2 [Salvia miltiorrhiza]|uniref:nuclear transport factor 2-like isoform X2 n=1 Tax=Salvia miltiorrhiza TaxID=226208 RepID=UPI0025ABF0F5|nr:nuclear transport factor 2-like isoform X2 [Salvia miltiorrhiza]
MEEKQHPSPADVADAFVKQFYVILNQCPENLHKFYQEASLQGWAGADGVVTPVTTLSGISEKVMSSDYKYCSVEVKTTDAQESMEGGIIVAVTGCLTGKDNLKRNFSQTFFLAKQEKGFFVLNDILRFFYVSESTTKAAPTQNSAPRDSCDGPTTLNFKAAIQNGKVEEASDLSISVHNLANGAAGATPSSILSGENKSASPVKCAKSQSVDAPDTNGKVSSAVKPDKNEKIPSVVTPALNVAPKITYASVLAKETPAISPRVAAVAVSVSKQAVALPTTKPSSPRGDISPKVSATLSGGVSSSSKVASKSSRGGQGIPSTTSAYAEAKGIYIGGLPYDITKQGIIDVVKQFGQVKRFSDTVQIRRHEDGFCCGFVEFESADSARRAVEAHHVMFGDKEAYIMYKKPYNRGNGRARSPTKRGPRNGNSDVTDNGDWTNYSQRPRQASRDRLQ